MKRYTREHRPDEKERKLSKDGEMSAHERRIEERQNWIIQRQSLFDDYEGQLGRIRQEKGAAMKQAKKTADKLILSGSDVVNVQRQLSKSQEKLELSQQRHHALEELLHRREKGIKDIQDKSMRTDMEYDLKRALLEARGVEKSPVLYGRMTKHQKSSSSFVYGRFICIR